MRTRPAVVAGMAALMLFLVWAPPSFATRQLHIKVTISAVHPPSNSVVIVSCRARDQYGVAIKGVHVRFTWHFQQGTRVNTARTNAAGWARAKRGSGCPNAGFKVVINVRATWNGQVKKARTHFFSSGST
jgi:hypothetical protein